MRYECVFESGIDGGSTQFQFFKKCGYISFFFVTINKYNCCSLVQFEKKGGGASYWQTIAYDADDLVLEAFSRFGPRSFFGIMDGSGGGAVVALRMFRVSSGVFGFVQVIMHMSGLDSIESITLPIS